MSNNKFHFKLKKKKQLLKFMIYFLHVQKRNYSYYLSLKFIIFICLKNKKFKFKL